MTTPPCPFCALPPDRIVAESDLAVAIRDAYPVNEGHTLVILRRHVATWFDATAGEQGAIFALIEAQRSALEEELRPAGYNIGINIGAPAGQTVMHLHVHLIPRFEGDVDDPTGGVRLVIPERGNYKTKGRIPMAQKKGGPR